MFRWVLLSCPSLPTRRWYSTLFFLSFLSILACSGFCSFPSEPIPEPLLISSLRLRTFEGVYITDYGTSLGSSFVRAWLLKFLWPPIEPLRCSSPYAPECWELLSVSFAKVSSLRLLSYLFFSWMILCNDWSFCFIRGLLTCNCICIKALPARAFFSGPPTEMFWLRSRSGFGYAAAMLAWYSLLLRLVPNEL